MTAERSAPGGDDNAQVAVTSLALHRADRARRCRATRRTPSTSPRRRPRARWSGTPRRRSSRAQKIADAVPEGDRHQGRDVPLRRLGDPAPLPAGDGRRPRRGRRADHFRSRRGRQCARHARALFVAFKPKNFDKVPDAAKDPNGCSSAQRLNLMTNYLRTDKVAGRRRAEDLGRSHRPEIQGQAGDDRSVVHLAAGVGGRHDVEGARLGLLREAARERHHDRAGQPAGRPTCSSAASG